MYTSTQPCTPSCADSLPQWCVIPVCILGMSYWDTHHLPDTQRDTPCFKDTVPPLYQIAVFYKFKQVWDSGWDGNQCVGLHYLHHILPGGHIMHGEGCLACICGCVHTQLLSSMLHVYTTACLRAARRIGCSCAGRHCAWRVLW